MNVNLHILNASGLLSSVTKQIEDEFAKSLIKISDKLPISDVDVAIYNNPRGTISELGIGGYTPNGHLVFVYLDSKFPNIKRVIKEQLKRTLAHELHHCLRWRNPGYGKTLLEALLTEGLADHFDLEVNGGDLEPWCTALNREEIVAFIKRAKIEYDNKSYDHRAWFFGSKEKSIPRWTGYALGFTLVENYLKANPDKKASKLYAIKAEEFVKEN